MKAKVQRHLQMKTTTWALLAMISLAWGVASAQTNAKPATVPTLDFFASGTNEFAFDTGVLQGKLRAGGKSTGLSSVVHVPTGLKVDHGTGLFGHYRVFSANKRYGTGAWDWPSQAKLRPDGAVEVHWPSAADRPFELSAVYRWAGPESLELETRVLAKTNLSKFECVLASYFSEGFTNASVVVRSNMHLKLEPATASAGTWQAFPRNDQAASIIQDGRWKFPPSPVDWIIRPPMVQPLGVRRCQASNVQAVIMALPEGCFAVLTPCETEPHRSMYLSLFGIDLQPGETAQARARLLIASKLTDAVILRACD